MNAGEQVGRRISALRPTDRQVEAALLTAVGATRAEVGAMLGVTARTAKYLVDSTAAKLGLEGHGGYSYGPQLGNALVDAELATFLGACRALELLWQHRREVQA